MKNLTSVLPFNVAEYSPVCMNIGDNSSDSLRGEILNNGNVLSVFLQSYKSQEGDKRGDRGKQNMM